MLIRTILSTRFAMTSDPKSPFHRTLTWVAVVEVILIVGVRLVMPFLRIRLIVVLHQRAKEDDEDDLKDEAGDWQLQPHVCRCICHGFS